MAAMNEVSIFTFLSCYNLMAWKHLHNHNSFQINLKRIHRISTALANKESFSVKDKTSDVLFLFKDTTTMTQWLAKKFTSM